MINLINPYVFDSVILPYRFDLMVWAGPDTVSGFNATRYQSSSALGGGRFGQQSAAAADSGDYYEINFTVEAGTWTFTILYQKNPNSPIHDIIVDGSSIGTIDSYAAGTTHNNLATISGVSLISGNHTLKVLANGKNASSGDYNLAIQSITLTRTGA